MALAQFGTRFKIGFHHAQLIEYFFDRASNPTIEKLAAHYPEHPRPGAPELGQGADLGKCIINALNIKRGYWKLPRSATSNPAQAAGISPYENTPESSGSGSGSGSGSSNQFVTQGQPNLMGRWSEGNSPTGANNPFITPAHGHGHIVNMGPGMGFGTTTTQSSNPYLATMGGNADSNEVLMKEMAAKIGSGDGFGSGPRDYSGVYSWSVSDRIDLQAEPAVVPQVPQGSKWDGGIKPLCYREG